ncbi:hypothetical protein PIB30_093405 [Stylosanthes scabra]|uniref:Uncharacterized protein n=1 Tax=Stylosanthes scabra TaxID=79078 RepID=A0ABU6TUN3_9FABA|nr:hypothetical protein [Stylosanthes scabra]
MASSSHTSKRKKGKQAILDDDDDENHDFYRFFTNFHEKCFEKYVASKAIIPSTKFKLQKGQSIQENAGGNTWHTKSHQMYSNWALQQMNPALTPILPMHIPFRIQSNVNENRPMFDGMLRPWPVGGESSVAAAAAPPQQAPSEANAPRRENPDSDGE